MLGGGRYGLGLRGIGDCRRLRESDGREESKDCKGAEGCAQELVELGCVPQFGHYCPSLAGFCIGTGSTNRAVAECYFSAVIRVNEDGCGVPIIFRIGCWAVLGADLGGVGRLFLLTVSMPPT